jgi:hypothetical protein
MKSGSLIDEKYTPGACNIGEEEVAQRRKPVIIFFVMVLVLIVTLEMLNADNWWRILTFFPAAGFAISLQQLTSKFCIAYGMKGLYNFGVAGNASVIVNEEYLKKDKEKVRSMIVKGLAFGIAFAVIYFFL